jgi:hypothetical protein
MHVNKYGERFAAEAEKGANHSYWMHSTEFDLRYQNILVYQFLLFLMRRAEKRTCHTKN